MAKYNDFLLDDNGDIRIENGDFVFGDPTQDEVRDIITDYAGHWRFAPYIGVGLHRYQNSTGKETEVERLIGLHLKLDGYEIKRLKVHPGLRTEIKATRL